MFKLQKSKGLNLLATEIGERPVLPKSGPRVRSLSCGNVVENLECFFRSIHAEPCSDFSSSTSISRS